jgi:predicted Zn-dependent protease
MTERKMQLLIGALVFVGPVLLLLPFVKFSGVSRGQINFYSLDDERRLGEEAVQRMESETPLVRHPRVSEYLQRLGAAIASGAAPPGVTYQFRMLDTPLVNAFALPGGFVYVTSGLVVAVRDEAQLAGVLAHEIAHVVARHGTQQLSREQLVAFFTSVGEAFLVGVMFPHTLPSAVTEVENLPYTRTDEIQADDLAVGYLYAAGYHPEGLATFLDLLRGSGRQSRLERFLSTHPLSADRARRLRARVSAWTLDDRWIRDSRAFHEIREMVRTRANAGGAARPAQGGQP